jgi:Na+/proline symporter
VYFSAIFSKRGNKTTVFYGLIGGFSTVLMLQPYIFGISIGFAWQIVIGTLVSFFIVLSGKSDE